MVVSLPATSMRYRHCATSRMTNGESTTPEDTLRFYALRLHDLGFVKSIPQRVIANGTDWRFLNELKRELKA